MKTTRTILRGAFLGGITSFAVMALFYLGERLWGLPFVPFDRFDWLARTLPGDLVTTGIDGVVTVVERLNLGATDTASKTIEQLLALALTLLIGLGLGSVIGAITARMRSGYGWLVGLIAGLILFVIMAAIELNNRLSGAATALQERLARMAISRVRRRRFMDLSFRCPSRRRPLYRRTNPP